jgi:hypothetical protein
MMSKGLSPGNTGRKEEWGREGLKEENRVVNVVLSLRGEQDRCAQHVSHIQCVGPWEEKNG